MLLLIIEKALQGVSADYYNLSCFHIKKLHQTCNENILVDAQSL